MYGLMTQWQADESQFEYLVEGLRAQIIPMVQSAPGFIEGFWGWDHTNGKTYDLVLFDTEEHARALKEQVEAEPEPDAPIRFEVARVVEITADVTAPVTSQS